MPVKSLKAKERYVRVHCEFLSLSNSYLIQELCTKKRNQWTNEINISDLTTEFLRGYYGVIEETLLFQKI